MKMLKPEQLKTHRFISAGRGTYEADDVDSFFSEVTASYEQMFRENGELVKKISLLAERVSQYKNDEDNIRRALLTAERMADKIQREAQQAAQEQLDSAEKKSQELIASAQNRADVLETAASVKASQLNEESQRAASERITNAERTASVMISDAEKKSNEIIEEAKRTAQAELDRINSEIKVNSSTLEVLSEEVTHFKRSLLDVYRKHIELITSLPERECAEEQTDTSKDEASEPSENSEAESNIEPEKSTDSDPVTDEEISPDFDETLSDEPFAPDEIVANDIAKAAEKFVGEESDVDDSDDNYDPLMAAVDSFAVEEPGEKNDDTNISEPSDTDESDNAEESDSEKEDFLKGFVIDLDEIESDITSDAEKRDEYETVSENQADDSEQEEKFSEPETHSRFRGFFKK